MGLNLPRAIRGMLGPSVVSSLNSLFENEHWVPPRALERHLNALDQSLLSLQDLLRDDSRWESRDFMKARNEVLRDVFYDPSLVWSDREKESGLGGLVEKGVLKVARVDGETRYLLGESSRVALTDLIIGTASFPETSSNVMGRCVKHSSLGKPLDKTCVACLRASIYWYASDVFNHGLMFRGLKGGINVHASTSEHESSHVANSTSFNIANGTPYDRKNGMSNVSRIVSKIPAQLKVGSSKEKFIENFLFFCKNHLGSGWTWLVYDTKGEKVDVLNTPNHICALAVGFWPLLCLDMWEHAWAFTEKDFLSLKTKKNFDDNDPPPWTRAARRKIRGLPSLAATITTPAVYTSSSPQEEKEKYVSYLDCVDWEFVSGQIRAAQSWQTRKDVETQKWDSFVRSERDKAEAEMKKAASVEKLKEESLDEGVQDSEDTAEASEEEVKDEDDTSSGRNEAELEDNDEENDNKESHKDINDSIAPGSVETQHKFESQQPSSVGDELGDEAEGICIGVGSEVTSRELVKKSLLAEKGDVESFVSSKTPVSSIVSSCDASSDTLSNAGKESLKTSTSTTLEEQLWNDMFSDQEDISPSASKTEPDAVSHTDEKEDEEDDLLYSSKLKKGSPPMDE